MHIHWAGIMCPLCMHSMEGENTQNGVSLCENYAEADIQADEATLLRAFSLELNRPLTSVTNQLITVVLECVSPQRVTSSSSDPRKSLALCLHTVTSLCLFPLLMFHLRGFGVRLPPSKEVPQRDPGSSLG